MTDLSNKDALAMEGFRIALDAVDAVFKTLLEEVQIRADAEAEKGPSIEGVGTLMRLAVQRQTIEALRKGIPAAILDANTAALRGAVG